METFGTTLRQHKVHTMIAQRKLIGRNSVSLPLDKHNLREADRTMFLIAIDRVLYTWVATVLGPNRDMHRVLLVFRTL